MSILGTITLVVPAASAPTAVQRGFGGVESTAAAGPTAKPSANEGLPRRWFAVIETSFTSRHGTGVTNIETFARATFTLTRVIRRGGKEAFSNAYEYRPTGTLRARVSRTDRDCTWKGSGTVPLTPSHGGLAIGTTNIPGKKLRVEYGLVSASYVGGRGPTVQVTLKCPDFQMTSAEAIHWTGNRPVVRTKTTDSTVQDDHPYAPPAEGFRRWCLARKESDLERCTADELEAVARISSSKLRAATRTLDGSRSKGDITSYEWTFDQAECTEGACAGYCDQVGPKAGAKKRGARATIKPLCTVQATLTVSDGQDEDSDTILVPVTPRTHGWKTQVLHRWVPTPATGAPSGAPREEPVVKCHADGSCAVALKGGLNVPDPKACAGQEVIGSNILCPLLDGRRTWNGRGYTLATIADPGGPFDGYSYVKASTLVVRRLAYINPYLVAGTWYDYNKKHGGQIDALLEATKRHEGFGAPGKPGTGHTQIMRDIIAGSGGLNDPRHEIETFFDPGASKVHEMADKEIERIDKLADEKSNDPLQSIGRFALWFYDSADPADPADDVWVPGLLSVP